MLNKVFDNWGCLKKCKETGKKIKNFSLLQQYFFKVNFWTAFTAFEVYFHNYVDSANRRTFAARRTNCHLKFG